MPMQTASPATFEKLLCGLQRPLVVSEGWKDESKLVLNYSFSNARVVQDAWLQREKKLVLKGRYPQLGILQMVEKVVRPLFVRFESLAYA